MIHLSIIVPVYNTPIDKLETCLKSILDFINSNTALNAECVIIDDGSRESISEWCQKFILDYSNFKLHKKSNEGVSVARNIGLSLSNGRYITFIDSDDIMLFVNDLPKYLLSQEYDLIFTDLSTDREQLWKAFEGNSREIDIETIISRIVCDGTLNGPYCKFIKRELLEQHCIRFDKTMITGEDLVFFIHLLSLLPKMLYISECSYIYNLDNTTSNNRLRNYPDTIINNNMMMYQEMIDLICNCLPVEKQMFYKLKATKRFLKQIFNIASDLIVMGLFSQKFKNKIKCLITNLDVMMVKEINKNKISKSAIQLSILLKQNWVLLAIISKFRLVYLNIKSKL